MVEINNCHKICEDEIISGTQKTDTAYGIKSIMEKGIFEKSLR